MSILGVAFIALVVLALIVGGIVVGWSIGTNDRQIDVLARRLSADAAISKATRETLHAMRDAVRRPGRWSARCPTTAGRQCLVRY